jgi:O-antigen/teichoic acid export membrane protein
VPTVIQVRKHLSPIAPVGVGLALLGFSAYVVLGLAGHALEPRQYSAIAALYLVIAVAGPGVFVAIEQETSREVSRRVVNQQGTSPVLRAASLTSVALAAIVALGLLALSPLLVPLVFAGSWLLVAAALVAVAGAAATYVLRGSFVGRRQHGWYSTTLATEGLARAVPCAVLVAVGLGSMGNVAFAFAIGTAVAAGVAIPGIRRGAPGPTVSLVTMARNVGLLVGASGMTLLMVNLAPIVLTARLIEDPQTTASFISVFLIARIPLFLVAPVQAFLVPSLTATAQSRSSGRLLLQVRRVVYAAGMVGLLGAAGTAMIAPWAAQVFFDAPIRLSPLVAGLLGVSTAVMIVAMILQPALVALSSHHMATAAWTTGTLLLTALLFAPADPVQAAVVALLAGPMVVVVIMVFALRPALARLSFGRVL